MISTTVPEDGGGLLNLMAFAVFFFSFYRSAVLKRRTCSIALFIGQKGSISFGLLKKGEGERKEVELLYNQ